MHSVVLVEDDTATRRRLAEALAAQDFLQLLGTAENCAQAREMLAASAPDVLLVDLGLPDGSGIDLIAEAHGLYPDTDIMVITVFGDERHVLSAVEAGATGYLLKDGSTEHIGRSVWQLIEGGSPISAPIARHLLRRLNPQPAALEGAGILLTPREQQVLDLVAKGFSYAEIGDHLGMAVNTVASHIKQLYRKLAVHSRSEAVFEAVQRGLLDWRA